MITNRQQLEEWIKDNNLVRWKFFLGDPTKRSDDRGTNDCIADSAYYPGEIDNKIELTAKQLERSGVRAYGIGFHTDKAVTGGMTEVAQLSASYSAPSVAGVGMTIPVPQPVNEEEIAKRIRKEIMAEIRESDYEKRLKELRDEQRAFEKEKSGAIGLLVQYTKPILAALGQKHTLVAGLDAPDGVEAEPINSTTAPDNGQTEPKEEYVFSDEEAEELMALMERFKKVEPDYLAMLRKVVTMAESGDDTYKMAKKFLV